MKNKVDITPTVASGPGTALPRGNVYMRHFRSALITGLITIFPLWVTLTVLVFIFTQATTFSRHAAEALIPPVIYLIEVSPPAPAPPPNKVTDPVAYEAYLKTNPEKIQKDYDDYKAHVANIQSWISLPFALLISIVVVYILGVLGNFVIGRRLLAAVEHLVENLPLVKGIYGTVKQVIGVFRQGTGGAGFQRVVLVEFPRRETWCIAFVTNTITDTSTNHVMVCVFIPMTPNPTSGYFQIFPLADVRDTDWSVDQGIKILLSGGLLAPPMMPVTGAGPAVASPTVSGSVSPPTA